jgi:hypothetical protein
MPTLIGSWAARTTTALRDARMGATPRAFLMASIVFFLRCGGF